jgi:hypothetical protein
MIRNIFCASVVLVFGCTAQAISADLASLEMGEFVTSSDSEITPKSVSIDSKREALHFSMKLDSLAATADGSKMEGSSTFSGNFTVMQPYNVSLPVAKIELKGHIVKTAASTARLDIIVGDAKEKIIWDENEVAAGVFDKTLNVVIANGVVPVVFPVSATLLVTKSPGSGAIFISLDSIDVEIGPQRVASNER